MLTTQTRAGGASALIRGATMADLPAAERYFPSFGFERITRDEVPADVQTTKEFHGACPASATVMRRASHRSREAPSS